MTHGALVRIFRYLDDLRASSEVNMYGARPYVAVEFDLSPKLSEAVLLAWMRTFDGKRSATARARAALRTQNELKA